MNIKMILKIVKLGRLQFLIRGFLLFLFGALLAVVSGATFGFDRFIVGYAILFMAHLSVSYSNGCFDIDVDRYATPTFFSGGSRVLVENPELHRFSKWFAVGLICLSLTLAIFFIMVFSYPVTFLLFVIFGNFLGWYYTAPPIKLTYRGLGELSTMITAGLFIPGMGYLVIMGQFDFSFVLFVIPLLLYGLAFIINVEIPDIEGDRLGNKNTFIVRKGRRVGFVVIGISLSLVTLYFLVLSLINVMPTLFDFRLITMFSLIPCSLGLFSIIKRPDERKLATKLVMGNLSSLFVVILTLNFYFLFLLKQ